MTEFRLKNISTSLVVVFGMCLVIALGPLHQKSPRHSEDEPKRSARPLAAENLVQLEIELGINQKQQTFWSGELRVSPGRILSTEVVRAGPDATIAKLHVIRNNEYVGLGLAHVDHVQVAVADISISRFGLPFFQSSPKGTSSSRMCMALLLVIVSGKQLPIGRISGCFRSAPTPSR